MFSVTKGDEIMLMMMKESKQNKREEVFRSTVLIAAKIAKF